MTCSSKTLVQKIRKREEFLEKAVSFIEELVRKHGRVVERVEGSAHIRVVEELADFGVFSFKTDFAQTMFGGNEVSVWYHPSPGATKGKELVLKVYYQAAKFRADDCRVDVFKDNPGWQAAFKRTMKRKDKILAERATKQLVSICANLKEANEELRLAELAGKAERLKVK